VSIDDRRWDAIVAGASFGGLAAALALAGAGRVLLIDRDPVGAGQTSACAAPVPLLERLDLLEAVEQVHETCLMHLPGGGPGHPFRMRHAFATFDYDSLCQMLFARTGAAFLQATVQGLGADGAVLTSEGEHRAPVVIDASGWRAVLARSRGRASTARRSVGVELRLPGGGEGLHFWVHDETIRDGYVWDFPAAGHRRVGVITYGESRGLRARLDRFLGRPTRGDELHGGALPARLGQPTAGDVFLVGDAAGQCLPLTGEGIRPALVYGWAAGALARRVLAHELPLAGALRTYRRLVRSGAVTYGVLRALQGGLARLPRPLVGPLSWVAVHTPLIWIAEQEYWAVAPMDLLDAPALARPAA
jgi:digeranylgeranylglycerophospholipid reductase